MLTQHKTAVHTGLKRKATTSNQVSKRLRQSANALGVFSTMFFHPKPNEVKDLSIFQDRIIPELQSTLDSKIDEHRNIKWHMIIKATFERMTPEKEMEETYAYFRTNNYIELTSPASQEHLVQGFQKIQNSIEEFTRRGSGWILKRINHLELKITRYHPLAPRRRIQTPKFIQEKKAILNIENEDEKCIVWCLIAHRLQLEQDQHPERVSNYTPYEDTIKLGDVKCPVQIKDIPKIENLNKLRINVFGLDKEEVYPLYISSKENEDVVNLLVLENEETHHYTLIRNFSRLMSDLTNHNGECFYCYRCLHRFKEETTLNEHSTYCSNHTAQRIVLPQEGDKDILSFTATYLQHKIPYVVYADFESLLVPISSVTPAGQKAYQEKKTHHVACSYAYIIIGPKGLPVNTIKFYRGQNAVEHFLDAIIAEKEILAKTLKTVKPMKLSSIQEQAFQKATFCSICKQPLFEKRVRDHDHVTGDYRGAAHPHCNLNYRQSRTIPVIFHNLKNYDAHHIMQHMGKFNDHTIDVIATTLEKYIGFKIQKKECTIQLMFLDSFQHLPTSLEKLVNNLDEAQFHILKSQFPSSTDFSLLTRKGVYPYDYFTCLNKFEESVLPPPAAFHNSLTNEDISLEDYQHAENVWKTFNMKTLGEYHDLYLKTDVLLLADVFENYRQLCLQYYDIDSAHTFTSPSLSWQACLKKSKKPLQLLTDIDMLLMFEKGIRGGVSMISHRHAQANIPNTKEFDPEKAPSYIMYWDANNLYGWAMSEYLPFGGFEWISPNNFMKDEKIDEEKILGLSDTASQGYIFEIDLDYPASLHKTHNDYPVALERLTVTEDMLSPFAKSIHPPRKYVGTPKLVPNLQPKSQYIIHYRNLKYYMQLGLQLTKIHRVIQFNQSPWLKDYIEFNTTKRKASTSSFEKDFFKLLNNAVYGKTLENLRKRRNIELTNCEKRSKKLVASPNFKTFKIFNEDLVAVERTKQTVLMNRPIYIGFCVLELSKLLMYQFHYGYVKEKYSNRAQLLFTDIDSLCYHIQTENIYDDMKEDSDHFDFSDYPPGEDGHFLHSNKNKKVLGKFKDELNGELAIEFIGLKAKMYSIKTMSSTKKKSQGGIHPYCPKTADTS